jgi:hypothetical protein
MAEIRRITERNSDGVRRTRIGTADLQKMADSLAGNVRASSNGNGTPRRNR